MFHAYPSPTPFLHMCAIKLLVCSFLILGLGLGFCNAKIVLSMQKNGKLSLKKWPKVVLDLIYKFTDYFSAIS